MTSVGRPPASSTAPCSTDAPRPLQSRATAPAQRPLDRRSHDCDALDALRRGRLRLQPMPTLLPPGVAAPQPQARRPASAETAPQPTAIAIDRSTLAAELGALAAVLAPFYGPQAQSPDALRTLCWLLDPGRHRNPKLEVRRTVGVGNAPGECVQLALCTRSEGERAEIAALLSRAGFGHNHEATLGGEVTLEYRIPGVTKEIAVRYAQAYLPALLDLMDYVPGPSVDARRQRVAVLADADGTLYEKQETCPNNPLGANLAGSAARQGVLDYLRSGGVLGIITGNDLARTATRFAAGIPVTERHLLRRVFLSGNGGASLAVWGRDGTLQEVPGYRRADPATGRPSALAMNAASAADTPAPCNPPAPLARVLYLGDDARPEGNDFPAFAAVGETQAICVSDHARCDLPALLRANHLPGGTAATGAFLSALTASLARNPQDSAAATRFAPEHVAQLVAQCRRDAPPPPSPTAD